jgi:hypothetical protein
MINADSGRLANTSPRLDGLADLKHDGSDPTPPAGATSANGGLPSLPSHLSTTHRDVDSVAGAPTNYAGASSSSPPPANAPGRGDGGIQAPPCRYRPGSKVFYNRYDGPPVKGTVVSANGSTTYGAILEPFNSFHISWPHSAKLWSQSIILSSPSLTPLASCCEISRQGR